jgi:hypothetical protein
LEHFNQRQVVCQNGDVQGQEAVAVGTAKKQKKQKTKTNK